MPTSAANPAACGACGAPLVVPIVCGQCRALYPLPDGVDFFDLLGVERNYRMDDARLTTAYRSLARNIHPDRFAGASDSSGSLATRLSAEVNQAYNVLRDPVLRADYLLCKAGGPDATTVRDVPGDLLAEVLMIREEMDAARSEGDAAALERLRASLADRREATVEQLGIDAARLAAADDAARREFRKRINSIKYFDNLLSDLAVDPLASNQRVNNA